MIWWDEPRWALIKHVQLRLTSNVAFFIFSSICSRNHSFFSKTYQYFFEQIFVVFMDCWSMDLNKLCHFYFENEQFVVLVLLIWIKLHFPLKSQLCHFQLVVLKIWWWQYGVLISNFERVLTVLAYLCSAQSYLTNIYD